MFCAPVFSPNTLILFFIQFCYSLTCILTLYSHLCLGLPSCLFLFVSQARSNYEFFLFHASAAWRQPPTHIWHWDGRKSTELYFHSPSVLWWQVLGENLPLPNYLVRSKICGASRYADSKHFSNFVYFQFINEYNFDFPVSFQNICLSYIFKRRIIHSISFFWQQHCNSNDNTNKNNEIAVR